MITIVSQPATNKLMSAYRPVISLVQFSNIATSTPPSAVYCDVYIGGVYYKTVSKTQPVSFSATDSVFKFDVQDALQEYIEKYLYSNGGTAIETDVLNSVYCRFRSSSIDVNGFSVPDVPVPIQSTGLLPATAGGGTEGNTFYAVNMVLQHEDNQDVSAHLNSFKNGTWAATAWPLTHRPQKYKLCNNDSDFFPIINLGNPISCLRINYRTNILFRSLTKCYDPPCILVTIASYNVQDAVVGQPYSATITLQGTAPFGIPSQTLPDWMSASLVGNVCTLSGTPTEAVENQNIEITFENACGEEDFNKSINVTDATECTPVGIISSLTPNATVGHPYLGKINLSGTAPFTIGSTTIPSWMTVSISGSIVFLGGTPTSTASGVEINIPISNACGEVDFNSSIDVVETPDDNLQFINQKSDGSTIDNLLPMTFYLEPMDEFPINSGESKSTHQGGFSGTVTVVCTVNSDSRVEITKNGVPYMCNGHIGTGAQSYTFVSCNFLATDNIVITLKSGSVCP